MFESSGGFPRSSRLLKAAEFRWVFQRPSKSADRWFTLLARPGPLDHPRLGLAISKKHIKRAVDRNRIKRIVRESFRQHQDELPALDFVVMAKGGAQEQGSAVLFESLMRHWQEFCVK